MFIIFTSLCQSIFREIQFFRTGFNKQKIFRKLQIMWIMWIFERRYRGKVVYINYFV